MNKIKIFQNWKKDFFELQELDYFDVYLISTFNDYYNGKFKNFKPKKYSNSEINNMSDSDIAMLSKFQNLNYTDVDIIITNHNDVEKVEKIFKYNIELNKKYKELYFDLKFFKEATVVEDYNKYYNQDYTNCKYSEIPSKKVKLIGLDDNGNIDNTTIDFPYDTQKHYLMMGYEYIKPTLLKNKVL